MLIAKPGFFGFAEKSGTELANPNDATAIMYHQQPAVPLVAQSTRLPGNRGLMAEGKHG